MCNAISKFKASQRFFSDDLLQNVDKYKYHHKNTNRDQNTDRKWAPYFEYSGKKIVGPTDYFLRGGV